MNAKLKVFTFTLIITAHLISGCTGGINPGGKSQNGGETPPTEPTNDNEPVPPLDISPSQEADSGTPEGIDREQPPISYEIDARLDYSAKQIEVEQTINLVGFLAGIQEMALIIEPNRYSNGFELHSLELNQVVIDEYSIDGNQLRFISTEETQNSGNGVIHLNYTVNLPQIPPPSEMYKPQPFGFTERQINLVDWYAMVPPLDETKNWIIHKPPIFGEALVYPAANYKIDLTIQNYNLPLVVAASSLAEQKDNVYSYSMQSARTFAISISPYYQSLEREVEGITINAYAFEGYADQNSAVLQNAAEALVLYTEKFGPLPIKSVSIVQADFLDGMEYSGLYFLSKGFYDLYDESVKGYLTLIAVHEMAHQWWFGVIGSDQALEPWLDEGLATFAELQYIERYHPDLTVWWWDYRVNVYEPTGAINLSIYDYSSYTAYRNAVYLRGAKYLSELRSEIGVEAFDQGMKRYYQKNFQKIANREDFFAAMNIAVGKLSAQLLSRYFK